jgi:ribosomal protein L14E/L6E/L27E
MQIGQLVYSKKGRDKGLPFIVTAVQNDYVYLADGRLRPLGKPKKKKIKHIQATNTIIDLTVFNQCGLKDSDVRKLLEPFSDKVK